MSSLALRSGVRGSYLRARAVRAEARVGAERRAVVVALRAVGRFAAGAAFTIGFDAAASGASRTTGICETDTRCFMRAVRATSSVFTC